MGIMILNEGNTCETIAEEVEREKPNEEEEGEDEGEKEEKEPDKTWKFKAEQLHLKYERPSLDGCVYRGEGNANVVLALPCERKVVRFRKSSPTSEASPDGGCARTTREIEFLKYVVSSFLGDYVEPPEPLRVTPEEMNKVSEAIRPLRPEYRRRKEIVEDYATIFKDYAFIPTKMTNPRLRNNCRRPTFCVEIKPKQGFRHENDEQFKKCTYCLTQYYKLKTGAIKSRSSYCPFDLFSGDKERMKKSILGLIQSPQNNFKIFKDGVVVYDLNSDKQDLGDVFDQWFSSGGPRSADLNFDKFFKLVHDALLREFSTGKQNRKRNINRRLSFTDSDQQPHINQDIVSRAKKILYFDRHECNFAGNDLPPDSVLQRILDMQQLPYRGADFVYKIYSKHFETLNDATVYSQMIGTYREENNAAVINGKKMDSPADPASSRAGNCSANMFKSRSNVMSDSNGNENEKLEDPSLDFQNNNDRKIGELGGGVKGSISVEELEVLQNYLLVTTAKDCSILMAFQEIDSGDAVDVPDQFIIRETEGVNFLVNIGVLDLDPKSIHCVEKHRQRDTNVLISLASTPEKEDR